MSVSEPARPALSNRLGEVIGPENAETLMSSLPLQPAAELATKDDTANLRAEMHELRTERHELRTDVIGNTRGADRHLQHHRGRGDIGISAGHIANMG